MLSNHAQYAKQDVSFSGEITPVAKFLNTSATNYFLEDLIKTAQDRLILISPFLKLNDRMKELLSDKNRLKIDVRIVYGKSELQPEEINWLKELTYIRTSFCKNLHAKCYLNENNCIITSLNLYEFSQVNNNEMGVLASRTEDAELYQDAYEEAQRIIRISDEVRISLERVDQHAPTPAPIEAVVEAKLDKLTSSKMAQKLGLKTPEFISKMTELGYLELRGDKPYITEQGKQIGGEYKYSPKFGSYFIWPDDLSI